MNIALIAHDRKKELMVQFCMAYCGILAKHNICATGTTGKFVEEATGLKIDKCLAGMQGGEEQISARVAYNEIDLVLFFRVLNALVLLGNGVDKVVGSILERNDTLGRISTTHRIIH